MDYLSLQNGSDIRGVAMEGIAGQSVNLGEQACRDIGRGFAVWLIRPLGKGALRVAIGRDSRLSGPALSGWLGEALASEGVAVTDFGMASTPNTEPGCMSGGMPDLRRLLEISSVSRVASPLTRSTMRSPLTESGTAVMANSWSPKMPVSAMRSSTAVSEIISPPSFAKRL